MGTTSRLRVLALLALAAALAPSRAASAAEENTVGAAMTDFRGSMDASGMRKLKAALAADPSDEECFRALPKPDDPVIKRLVSRKGESQTLAEDLAARADRARRSQGAIDLALRWLAAHQASDGRWSSTEFGKICDGNERDDPPDVGLGFPAYDAGLTGLATLAFLHAGFTHKDVHPYGKAVLRALEWMQAEKDGEGCIGRRDIGHFLYCHAACTAALLEAYARTGDAALVESGRAALDFLVLAQNPGAGWRYGVRPGDNDTSMTAWATLVFEAAKRASQTDSAAARPPSFPYPSGVEAGIRAWVRKATDHLGRGGYIVAGTGPARTQDLIDKYPAELSEAMTAAGLCMRVFLGERIESSKALVDGARLCADLAPAWTAKLGDPRDYYYWHYATHALRQIGGADWLRWRTKLVKTVVPHQRTDGTPCEAKGSWDPADAWGADGGRVYSTSMLVLSLSEIVGASRKDPDPPIAKAGAPPPPAAGTAPAAPGGVAVVADAKTLEAAWTSLRAGQDDAGIAALAAALASEPTDPDVAATTPPETDATVKRLLAKGGDGRLAVEDALARAARVTQVRKALALSLRWLAAHQSPDGRWLASGFASTCDGKTQPETPGGGAGRSSNDVAVTGLALSAFLDAGFSPKDAHPYASVIARGAAWLASQTDPQGVIGSSSGNDFLYREGAAAKAMIDAYRAGGDPALVESARRTLALLVRAQKPGAGWRYEMRPTESDTASTAWVALVFESAKRVNDADVAASRAPTFPYPPAVETGMRAWFDSVTDAKSGHVGYAKRGMPSWRPDATEAAFPGTASEATTACGLSARVFLGERTTSPAFKAGVERLLRVAPTWKVPVDPARDFYYWRFGAHALRSVGGLSWRRWRSALVTAVAKHQVVEGDVCANRGSWDPVDPFGADGGRIYATAMLSIAIAEITSAEKAPPEPPLPAAGAPPPAATDASGPK